VQQAVYFGLKASLLRLPLAQLCAYLMCNGLPSCRPGAMCRARLGGGPATSERGHRWLAKQCWTFR